MTLSYPAAAIIALLPILAALMPLAIMVGGVSAASPIKLGLAPVGVAGANFVLTMQPSETRDLGVLLTNFGSEPLRAKIFAADAYSMVNGGFAARSDGEPSGGTTNWLNFPGGELDLAPGAPIERDFAVAVPAGTSPGEYLTTIVLQNADATSSDAPAPGGMVLKQIVRQIVAVSVDIPGTRTPALELGPMTHNIVSDRSTISVAVNNVGNVRLKPTGEFVLYDSVGAEVSRFTIVMDTAYAHTDTFAEIPFSRQLNPGDYSAEVSLKDASGFSITSGRLPLTISRPVADSAPVSSEPAAAPAQSNQAPLVSDDSTHVWMMLTIAFGAGLGLMLAGGGAALMIYQRRAKKRS